MNPSGDSPALDAPACRAPSLARRLIIVLGVLIIFGAVAIVYYPARNGGYVWDDRAHVTSSELSSWTGLIRIWTDLSATQQYYPLLHSAFWVEHSLWGDNTF